MKRITTSLPSLSASLLAFLALMTPVAPIAAQNLSGAAPTISLEQRMLVRCSAAFAVVANRQQSGADWALAHPPLAERGQEFFIYAAARVMNEAGLTDAQIEDLLRAEAQQLWDDGVLEDIMPVCLRLLDQSGL